MKTPLQGELLAIDMIGDINWGLGGYVEWNHVLHHGTPAWMEVRCASGTLAESDEPMLFLYRVGPITTTPRILGTLRFFMSARTAQQNYSLHRGTG